MSPDPIRVQSDRLTVEVAQPDSVYRRTRFDWTGFVTQVTLDGAHTFCVPESYDPRKGTGGVGLCGEFGYDRALGYAEAKPGDLFPKLGIGLLRKPDNDPVRSGRAYEIVTPFPVRIEQAPTQVTFTVDPVPCNGYAARTTKTLRVDGSVLEIAEQLENVGTKPIQTEEYYHNFVGLDEQPVGPAYRLTFPCEWKPEPFVESFRTQLPGLLGKITPGFVLTWLVKLFMDDSILTLDGNCISFKSTPRRMFYSRSSGFHRTDQPQWEMAHIPTGVSTREVDDFAPFRVAIWGASHVVSAEVFVDLDVAPGETQTWCRRYEFSAL